MNPIFPRFEIVTEKDRIFVYTFIRKLNTDSKRWYLMRISSEYSVNDSSFDINPIIGELLNNAYIQMTLGVGFSNAYMDSLTANGRDVLDYEYGIPRVILDDIQSDEDTRLLREIMKGY
tara:strand:+ start:399 stop:755 length:357 start_codon:yes stop_codon:yes gene_type:complete